jgi:hypothetical protein
MMGRRARKNSSRLFDRSLKCYQTRFSGHSGSLTDILTLKGYSVFLAFLAGTLTRVCALSVSGMMRVIVWSSLFVICGSVFFGGQEWAVSGTFDF